jgi:hypothetical protein
MKRTEVMERAGFLRNGETMVFQFDFSNLAVGEAREVVDYGKTIIARMPHNSVLTLTDVHNVVFDDKFNALAKELVVHNKPYVKAGAVIGVTGWRKVAYWASLVFSGRDNLKLFDDAAEAKSWLTAYAGK